MLSQPLSPRKAADSSIIDKRCRTALAFLMMQGQKLLSLRWRSLLEHSSDVVVTMFA